MDISSKFFILIFSIAIFTSCSSSNGELNKKTDPISLQEKTTSSVLTKPKSLHSPIYTSSDFGKTWQDESHGLPKDVQVSFLEKSGNEIVMATDNKGIFLSKNNRTEWSQIGSQLPSKKINSLFVSEKNIFAGVYKKGIFTSNDNGNSWESLNFDLPNLSIQSILLFGNNLIAGTDEGIFQLDKKNKTWNVLYKNVQVLSLFETQEKLVAGTNQGSLLSEDNGETWNWIHKEGAVHYTHLVDNKIVEMALWGDLYISDDYGKSWEDIEYSPKQGSYIYEVIQVEKHWILSNNYGVHQSTDKGKNWKLIFKTEEMAFFDFLVFDDIIYGGTRTWDEYRSRSK